MRIPVTLLVLLLSSSLVACAAPAKRQSVGEYLDDTVITTKVKAALLNDEAVSGLAITVNTFNGVVQLGGFVDTTDEIRRAGRIAKQVSGVRTVKNDIVLKKPED